MNGRTILLAIDLQRVFADPESEWYGRHFERAVLGTQAMIDNFAGNVVFTRFLPHRNPNGAWQSYYRKWSFALAAPDTVWELVKPWTGRPSVDVTTLSKWGPQLQSMVGVDGELVLTGVATDCCVLATALAAIDDGVAVRVVRDACAAGDENVHRDAIALLERRSPLITISTVAEELASTS